MKLYEDKTFYDIVSHGNQYVEIEVDEKPVIFCPECFSANVIQKGVHNHMDKHICEDCGCQFTISNTVVTTKLFDILSYVFCIGAIILFVSFIIFACISALTKNKIFLLISIVSFIVSVMFVIILSMYFDESDY